jgi:hypothetical protein
MIISTDRTKGMKTITRKTAISEESNQIEISQSNPCSSIYFDGSSINCTSCNTHYINGICIDKVVDNCKKHDTTTLRCQECETGYSLYENVCQKCSDNCEICFNSTQCIQCKDNYYIKEQADGFLVEPPPPNKA